MRTHRVAIGRVATGASRRRWVLQGARVVIMVLRLPGRAPTRFAGRHLPCAQRCAPLQTEPRSPTFRLAMTPPPPAPTHPNAQDEAFRGREDGSVRVPVRRPDGDVELEDAGVGFNVPPCRACGGILKPDVVFFGDSVPKCIAQQAQHAASTCRAMLVVGSSLQVWSAFRLARAAKATGAPLALLSVGPNRADDLADLKVEARAGEVLARLAHSPRLLLPHVP